MKKRIIRYLKHTILKRRNNLWDRLLTATFTFLFPKRMERLEESLKESLLKRRIAILSPSDLQQDLYLRLLWSDCWVKYELIKAFGAMNCIVTNVEPDVVIHLFGFPTKLPKHAYKIVWIYSHPALVSAKVLSQYDKIFCSSSSFIKKINQIGFDAKLMIGATAKRPTPREIKYDIVFVGNSRILPYGRKIIRDIGDTPYNFKVWGWGWKKILPQKYYGGEYVDNQGLDELYASSLISLNDDHEDMNREGFVNVRIFDILASGGFCISNKNPVVKEIFGDSVPQYESPEHLKEIIDFYIKHPDERLKLMEKGRKIALRYNWQKIAEQFLREIENMASSGQKMTRNKWIMS